jgi:hypothetical protein
MEKAPERSRVLVRYAESAVALDEEDGAEHARLFRDADPGGLGHDGAHLKVNFAIEHLVSGIARRASDDPSAIERHERSTPFFLKALYEKF